VHDVSDLDAGLAALDGAARPALVLCNPNNPDGRRWSPDSLTAAADRLAQAGGTLVVDEAFADVAPEVSLAASAERRGLVVLRSFGKFFGLAGLRLGFALCAPTLAHPLARALGPWPVPGPALEVGRIALADDAWQTAMRARLAADAEHLRILLVEAGFDPVGGTPLYQLVRHADAVGWHDRLARNGVWVRAFPHRATWLRFGLPGDPAGWERLTAALAPEREPSGA
jgi:cobalamin biosynthetic protein CobC